MCTNENALEIASFAMLINNVQRLLGELDVITLFFYLRKVFINFSNRTCLMQSIKGDSIANKKQTVRVEQHSRHV
jgi:hypothetical protein